MQGILSTFVARGDLHRRALELAQDEDLTDCDRMEDLREFAAELGLEKVIESGSFKEAAAKVEKHKKDAFSFDARKMKLGMSVFAACGEVKALINLTAALNDGAEAILVCRAHLDRVRARLVAIDGRLMAIQNTMADFQGQNAILQGLEREVNDILIELRNICRDIATLRVSTEGKEQSLAEAMDASWMSSINGFVGGALDLAEAKTHNDNDSDRMAKVFAGVGVVRLVVAMGNAVQIERARQQRVVLRGLIADLRLEEDRANRLIVQANNVSRALIELETD